MKVEYRVIFMIVEGALCLLSGFRKTTMKTPAHERELALKRKRDLER